MYVETIIKTKKENKMAYGYTVKNNKRSEWFVSYAPRWGEMYFDTKRKALSYMKGNKETMVLVRKRTWLEKDDELRAFRTTQTERDELIMWDADKGVMFEKKEIVVDGRLYDEWQAIWAEEAEILTNKGMA
tara:strand:+ start:552 stop:944 length:393 start_codon:yes stop_codon:yes gene_type:complete